MRKHILGICPIPARRWVVELSAGCRRVKTFESFYHEDDMIREIAGFLDCPIEKIEFDPVHEKHTSMFRAYSVQQEDGEVDPDAIQALTDYMKEEHGLTLTFIKNDNLVYRLDYMGKYPVIYLSEGTLPDACMKWLEANHSQMEAVDSKDHPGFVLYGSTNRQGRRENVLIYNKEEKKVYLEYGDIWIFLKSMMPNHMAKALLKKWVAKAYDLKGVKIIFNNGRSYKWAN